MQQEGVSLNAVTFICSLKACGSVPAIDKGMCMPRLPERVCWREILLLDIVWLTCVSNVASLQGQLKCLTNFQFIMRSSWNAQIAGYTKHGFGEEALRCLEQMQLEGVSPDSLTFVCSLKACGSIGAIDKGQKIHAEIVRKQLLVKDPFLGNALVDMYAKCGSLVKAREVFDKLPLRNEVSWNALITGYAEDRLGEEALNCFEQMQLEGFCVNFVTFVCTLKACANIGAIDKGREIHAEIARKGLERDVVVGSTLVGMYAKCGLLANAREVFEKLPVQNVVSWTALIAGYAKHGFGEEALNCFKQMQLQGVRPNAVTFVCSLKACGSIGAMEKGQEIHAEIDRKGLLERHPFVGNALVDMYAKGGLLAKACKVFDKLPVRDRVSWNALIAGYAKHGCGEQALNCLRRMQVEGIFPDALTYVSSLKACGSIGAMYKGQEIHAKTAKKGLLERHPVVGNALIAMYAKCGSLAKAREVFDKLPLRNVGSWNTVITGYAEHGPGEEALSCFEQMQLEGVCMNAVTFVSILKACGSIRAIEKGQEIHADVARKGLEREIVVGSTLVDMYAKCGSFERAWEVFDKLPVQNVVSWTALIAGYAEHELGEEALDCFEQMQLQGVSPNAVTFVCSLKACGSIGAIDKGRVIHAEIARNSFLEREILVGNTLVDMYAKCGLISTACEVFNNLPARDVVSWNTLVAGYARLGESENVFYVLERMRGEGIKPNGVTFLSILAACNHTGLVEKGQQYFETMSKDYGIIPTVEHHSCMVDLFGRAGQLDEAIAIMKKMTSHPDLVMWHTVLGACRKWGNVELGQQAFEHAVQLDERDPAAYVLMSNIYADALMNEDEMKLEAMREKKQVWKKL